jgi:hypothetical protein
MTIPARSLLEVGSTRSTRVSGAGRIWLLNRRIAVLEEITKEATVILDVLINQARKAVRVDAVGVRLVVLLVPRVVYKEGI